MNAAAATETPTSQTMRAQLRLRELILSGEFGHGDRMSELPLVERLGVSRTPVRLALAKLEHEGLLLALPAGGYVVREFTRADIADATELRGVLEGTAARFAAERGPPRRELRMLHTISAEIGDVVHQADYASFECYVGLNGRFHATLVAMAGSELLKRALDAVTCVPFASATSFVLAEAELPASREILVVAHSQHVALMEAIERREGARAENIAREHARLALTNLELVLRHGMLTRVPGHSLTTLAQEAQAATVAQEAQAAQAATLAQAAQAATLAQEAQAATLAQEAQAATQATTLAQEAQAATLEQEAQAATLPQEAQAATLAQEARATTLAQEAQAATLAQEAEAALLS